MMTETDHMNNALKALENVVNDLRRERDELRKELAALRTTYEITHKQWESFVAMTPERMRQMRERLEYAEIMDERDSLREQVQAGVHWMETAVRFQRENAALRALVREMGLALGDHVGACWCVKANPANRPCNRCVTDLALLSRADVATKESEVKP